MLQKRSDAADVQAESNLHGYTLVADAKAFRMSRTARNQKDYKIGALSGWRKDAEYAVLCAPYFQYPKSQSQIFAQSIENNVCLLGWEHLIFMLKRGIRETPSLNLSALWNYGEVLSHAVVVADKKKNFLPAYDRIFLSTIGCAREEYAKALAEQISLINARGASEKAFWVKEKNDILGYSRNQAIQELIHSKKIDEKILQIEQYIGGLRND